MKKYFTVRNLLFLILVAAFLLRFWGIWNQDILGDEAADAFRAVGYIDYLGTNFQTQPIDWYKNQPLPFWTKLSFHDLPPLAILIEHWFFKIFGDSLLVARLPAAILGTFSALLIFWIAKEFFGEPIAILSAAIFGVGGGMVWIFRTSLLEPFLLFFIFLNIWAFLQFLKKPKLWWWFGLTLGMVALTKYTGFFLVPLYFAYLLVQERKILKDWRFYGAFFIALLVLSPVIVYNLYLYQARGHFDLQLAYLFHQNTPEWTGLVGKSQSPFSEIGINLPATYGWLALLLAAGGLAVSARRFLKQKEKGILFIWLYLFFATLLLIKIGSAQRFLVIYGLPFSLLAALALDFLSKRKLGKAGKIMIIALIILEGGYAIQKNVIAAPDYGIAKLDNYLDKEFRDKRSIAIPTSDNSHLNEVIQEFSEKQSGREESAAMIIYNDNIALPTLEWIFYRRFFYHAIPALYVENFYKALQNGQDYKFFTFYFIQSEDNTLLNPFKAGKTVAKEFEAQLQRQGIKPVQIIYGHDNLEMFRVYKFKS